MALMIDLNDEALQGFLEEAKEHLETLEKNLLQLEAQRAAPDAATINAIFRAAHTIKGTASFFALAPIKDVSHAMENVLGRIRIGDLSCEPEVVTALLEATSRLARMVHEVEALDGIEHADVIARLAPWAHGHSIPPSMPSVPPTGVIARAAPLAPADAAALGPDDVEVLALDGTRAFVVSFGAIAAAQRGDLGGRYVHYVERPESSLGELTKVAAIIAKASANRVDGVPILRAVCATVLDPDLLADMISVSVDRVLTMLDHLAILDAVTPPPPAPLARAAPARPAPTAQAADTAAPAAREAQRDPFRPPQSPAPAPAKSNGHTTTQTLLAGAAPPPSLRPVPSQTPPPASIAPPMSGARAPEGAGTIRVSVGQLDRLMSLAGELVLTRNALLKKASERDLDEMIELSQRVDAITSDLQDGIMATRMQQVGIVFTKFRRIVRDLSLTLHKKIDLEIEGEEVELDKTIIEAIGDPLTHLVRNSADHGIEMPSERVAAGKEESGKLAIRARHEAGQVVIEVSDDGRGIDTRRVSQKALEKHLRTREQLDAMSEDELVRLVFEPGFSTAEAVTEISGRGVGMDVVVSSLSRIGGTVDIRSDLGRGTTITVRLPLTLAIIASVLVEAGGERFAIPQVNLVELVRIPAREVQKRVERVGSATVMRLRGDLLPLLRLTEALGTAPPRIATSESDTPDRRVVAFDRRSDDDARLAAEAPLASDLERRTGHDRRTSPASAVNVAVVSSGNLRYGLVVDQLLDSEEIVVKPLGRHLRDCREYAGATILGDGNVALILDVAGLSAASNLSSTKTMLDAVEARRRTSAGSHDAHTYLVFENACGERFAVPLGIVSRIERIAERAIVRAGGRRTVTFGDTMLALVAIEDVAKVGARVAGAHFYAIVCKAWGREVGVMASRIVDVVDASAAIDSATHVQPGILGSTVVDADVLLLLDVHGLVEAVLPEYKKPPKKSVEQEASVVLVVEDSAFFRKQIAACLQDAGYATLAAEDGTQGLSLIDQHAGHVALVVTDIEMPKMDGLEMTRKIRADGRFPQLPIIAVTSLSGEHAERRGREAGLTEYLIKLDREQLVERTNHYLKRAQPIGIEHPSRAPKGALG
jgi:two-component system chemotaxis sensor kinase CheA